MLENLKMEKVDKDYINLYVNSFNIIAKSTITAICLRNNDEVIYITNKFSQLYKGKYYLGTKVKKLNTVKGLVLKKSIIYSPITGQNLGYQYTFKNESM